MVRQLIRSNKRLLILFVFGIITTTYSSAQKEDTTISLSNPSPGGAGWSITEAIYQAIDPRLIANKYGILREERDVEDTDRRGVIKRISLFIYDRVFPSPYSGMSPILDDNGKWNYFINDINMFTGGRPLISAIMPQAIESIDFTPPSPKDMPKTKIILPESFRRDSINKGAIRFYTRDISKSTINDSTTVYLLNGNKVITRKFFDAINPVFIRSLKRITNPEELADCGYKEKKEIVKIDLFDINDLINDVVVMSGYPQYDATLVDNIEIDWKIYEALNKFHIKEIREIEKDKEAFAPYRKLFSEKRLKEIKRVTVVSL